jgi:hypothetical protein
MWDETYVPEAIAEECAQLAETFDDFGPSTRCPDCGSDRQVLHWYALGRKDAAKAIRKEFFNVIED